MTDHALDPAVRPADASAHDADVLEVVVPFAEIPSMVGRPFRGRWLQVAADRLASFDHATYIDTEDGVGLDDTVYPEGLVEGFHLVGLLYHLTVPVVRVSDEGWEGWNYGIDKVRFTSPVTTNDRIRAVGTVSAVESRGNGFVVSFDSVIEVEGREKPGAVAAWRSLWRPPVSAD